MKPYKRISTIVIDSLGIGAMPNAVEYDDEGADTLRHIDNHMPGFQIPNPAELGLVSLHPLTYMGAVERPVGHYGKLLEASAGKDITAGHWEMMGLHITKPFQASTDTGFPQELLDESNRRTRHKIADSKSAGNTGILDELVEHETATGDMIVYTSADSVLQICDNEETFGPDGLHRYCEIARELVTKDEQKVGQVAARSCVGKKKGEFKQTPNRYDYMLKPYGKTALDALKEDGYDMISIGKIKGIFDDKGVTEAYKSKSSVHGMEQTLEIADKDPHGLCFVSLVDFGVLWGRRRDPEGRGQELEYSDVKLGELPSKLWEDDLLFITTDHGNDPAYKGTDHTEEMVPLLAYSPFMTGDGKLLDCDTFAAIGATIADNFKVLTPEGTVGTSILKELS